MNENTIVYISDASMLAVHALVYLAQHADKRVQTKEIAKKLNTSSNHLAKVMQTLVKQGYITSVKGPSGGFTLADKPEAISIRAIIETIDGALHADFCPFSVACNPDNCIFGKEFQEQAKKMVQILDKRTLKDMQKTKVFL